MGHWFWWRRFVVAFAIAAPVLFAVHAIKGHAVPDAAGFGCLWGAVAAAIFTIVGYVRYRRNPACMLPRRKAD